MLIGVLLNGLGLTAGFSIAPLQRGDFPLVVGDGGAAISVNVSNTRLLIWKDVWERLEGATWIELLLGHGAGELRATYRAAFNSPLEMLHDYGVLAVSLYACAVVSVLVYAFKTLRLKPDNHAVSGVVWTVYGFSFLCFVSWFPFPFFNFAMFSLLFGMFQITLSWSLVEKAGREVPIWGESSNEH